MDETALVPTTRRSVELGTLTADSPEELLAAASSIATPLAMMIDKQKLSNSIQGRRYVRCEGWTTMGAMLGIIPREVSNVCDALGVYTAVVELVSMRTGAVVGQASAECGNADEVDRDGKPVWAGRPAYARRSMAATRATSKAFRLSFSWIMTLAGYEATPAEEVPDQGFEDRPAVQVAKETPGKLVGRVIDTDFKEGKTGKHPWKKWGIRFKPEGETEAYAVWLGTFDEKIAAEARVLQATRNLAVATYTYDGQYRQLVSIALDES